MESFKQYLSKLDEVFEKPYKWKWVSTLYDTELKRGGFISDNNTNYRVRFSQRYKEDKDLIDASWGKDEKNYSIQDYDTEHSFKVISTVLDIIKEFLNIEKPEKLIMFHATTSRANIFNKKLKHKDYRLITKGKESSYIRKL